MILKKLKNISSILNSSELNYIEKIHNRKEYVFEKYAKVYLKFFDLREEKTEILTKAGLEQKIYLYVGMSSEHNLFDRFNKEEGNFKDRISNNLYNRKQTKFDLFSKKYIKFCKEKGISDADIRLNLYYSNIVFFYVHSKSEALEYETMLINELMLKKTNDIELISDEDGNVRINKTDNSVSFSIKNIKSQKNKSIRLNTFKEHIKLSDLTDAELYEIAFNCINSKMYIDDKEFEITKDNFNIVFEKLQALKKEN